MCAESAELENLGAILRLVGRERRREDLLEMGPGPGCSLKPRRKGFSEFTPWKSTKSVLNAIAKKNRN